MADQFVISDPVPVGIVGFLGPTGAAATVSVGTVSTGNPGSAAIVTNSGTSSAAVFNFTIPQGATGPVGAKGTTAWSDLTGVPSALTTGSNVANGYAKLDSAGLVPAGVLPSYVDDVLEFVNLAGFPVSGETGKIYVDKAASKIYRWSGTVYVEISPSPGSTDSVSEGSVNLYFTSARAAGAAPVQTVAGKTGSVSLVKGDVGLGNVDNTSDAAKAVLSATKLATARTINGVSFDGTANITITDSTKEATANKNQINGYAGLDSSGLVLASLLPSYVDDVLEYTNLAGFPATGETGKIYVDKATSKIYRWSGTVYVEISPSPGSTDSVTEGGTNLYFTTARAAAAAPVQSVAGRTGNVTLTFSDITSGSVAISSIASSTSAELGVGLIQLGHASDTTLSRSDSGVLAVEGFDVLTKAVVSVTGTTALAAVAGREYIVLLGSGAVPTLPTAVGNTSIYHIKNVHSAPIALAVTSSQTIDNSSGSLTILPRQSFSLISDNSNWWII
jgi:hypothetical protein